MCEIFAETADKIAVRPLKTQIIMSNITSVSINNRARFTLDETPDDEDIEIFEKKDNKQFADSFFLKQIKYRKEKNYKTIFLHGRCKNPAAQYRGRYYPVPLLNHAISVASLKRTSREILFPKEKWTEIDMVNSHYCLLWLYLRRKTTIADDETIIRFPVIRDIVFKREKVIDTMINNLENLPEIPADQRRDVIKKELLVTLYSFDKPTFKIFGMNLEDFDHSLIRSTIEFIKRLRIEVKNIMKITKCDSASHLSERISNLESEIMYELLNRFNLFEKRVCYLYDGLLIKNDQVEDVTLLADGFTGYITNFYNIYNYAPCEFIQFKIKN